jgi:hypothetical protein
MPMRYRTVLSLVLLAALGCGEDVKTDTVDDDTTPDAPVDDTDGDTIMDPHEGTDDLDGDGWPNFRDLDSDGDGIDDRFEAGDADLYTLPYDSDADGVADFFDDDSDGNCVADPGEHNPVDGIPGDQDADGVYDFADMDNDGDGIPDAVEIGESCQIKDHDDDGAYDYMDIDSDGDGIGDRFESGLHEWNDEPVDTDGDGTPDYLDRDSDDDGISDADEAGVDDPRDEPADTDGDGHYDFADTDSDGDSLSDWEEINEYGTDPYDSDTDGDGFSDGGEVAAGVDPLDPEDGIFGIYVEVPERTTVETEFEFELRIQRGDIACLHDTTCSMRDTLNATTDEFAAIVNSLESLIPDVEFGVATFDDYAYGGMGSSSWGDRPFILRQQVTDDVSRVQSVLASLDTHNGNDWPESSMEALFQAASGMGYDQNCNGTYESTTDVLPFIADPADPFDSGAGQSFDDTSSSGGQIGGMGFRDHALPVIVYATDADMRDPDAGYSTPGGCHLDAGASDAVESINDIGAFLIGIASNSTDPILQMEQLSAATGSVADIDGNGIADDPLVFHWTGSSDAFRTTIIEAIEDLVNSIEFERVELVVEGDEWGFVSSIDPPYYDDIDPEVGVDVLDFQLTFRGVVAATTEDQLYKLTLNVVGDGEILLSTQDIIIQIPGTAL